MGSLLSRDAPPAQQEAAPRGIDDLPDEVLSLVLAEAYKHSCDTPGCDKEVDGRRGARYRLVNRRFARCFEATWWGSWDVHDNIDHLERSLYVLRDNLARCKRIRKIQLVIEDDTRQREREGGATEYFAVFQRLADGLRAGEWANLTVFDLNVREIRTSQGRFSPAVRNVLAGLAAAGCPALRKLVINLQRLTGDDDTDDWDFWNDDNQIHLYLPTKAVAELLAAAPSLTQLELEGLLLTGATMIPMPARPLRLRRLRVRYCLLPATLIGYLASSLEAVEELSIGLVYSEPWVPAERLFVADQLSRALQTLHFNEKADEGLDVDALLRRHPHLRCWVQQSPNPQTRFRRFLLIHRLDATSLEPELYGMESAHKTFLEHLEAGCASHVKHIRMRRQVWSDGYNRHDMHALEDHCEEHDIALEWTDGDMLDTSSDDGSGDGDGNSDGDGSAGEDEDAGESDPDDHQSQ